MATEIAREKSATGTNAAEATFESSQLPDLERLAADDNVAHLDFQVLDGLSPSAVLMFSAAGRTLFWVDVSHLYLSLFRFGCFLL